MGRRVTHTSAHFSTPIRQISKCTDPLFRRKIDFMNMAVKNIEALLEAGLCDAFITCQIDLDVKLSKVELVQKPLTFKLNTIQDPLNQTQIRLKFNGSTMISTPSCSKLGNKQPHNSMVEILQCPSRSI